MDNDLDLLLHNFSQILRKIVTLHQVYLVLHYKNIGEFVLKNILIFLTALFLLSSCASNKEKKITFAKFGKPACEGTNTNLWHNCNGGTFNSDDFYYYGVWMNGKKNGKAYVYHFGTSCTQSFKNGLLFIIFSYLFSNLN